MPTILTKYLGPTPNKCSRVKAITHGSQSLTILWDDGLGIDENHDSVAKQLAQRLWWLDGHELVRGAMPGKTWQYAYVVTPKRGRRRK